MATSSQTASKAIDPKRMYLREGLEFNIRVAITDVASFNHYVLKEYAPRCQGALSISKSPAKHTLENCIYDELCGWLDEPTLTGLSVLEISAKDKPFSDPIVAGSMAGDGKIHFHEIVDLLYDVCKMAKSGVRKNEFIMLDAGRLNQTVDRCKEVLRSVGKSKINVSEAKKTRTDSVGPSLREKRVSGGLPQTP